ncbi:hypothetical protein FraQA3DRAFT_2623 [Frankia sp. QA3]|nr:hypothetical protein FraQA3DRAFT_2623 [Frankia sp. QA3]
MSLGHQLAAWDLLPGELSPQERVVLLALAEDARSGRDTCSPGHRDTCSPGHKVLTARTGLGRSQLSATSARLVSRGLVVLAERARRGRNAVYRLLFAERERPANQTQNPPTGTDHDGQSVRTAGSLPGSSSPRKNPVARTRQAASKIRRAEPTILPPSNAPTNRLRPAPRPDLSALPDPPEWAVEAARGHHQGDDVVSGDAPVDQVPDSAVSFADAAARLGLSTGTVHRYCAPSSGKLRRVGTGVSLASVEALAG